MSVFTTLLIGTERNSSLETRRTFLQRNALSTTKRTDCALRDNGHSPLAQHKYRSGNGDEEAPLRRQQLSQLFTFRSACGSCRSSSTLEETWEGLINSNVFENLQYCLGRLIVQEADAGRAGSIAIMLSGSMVVALANAIVPLYLCIALGYLSSKFRILRHEQTYVGIAGFINKFSYPILIFRMISTNDPYNMDLKLIAADTVYKVALLFILGIYCFYRPTHQSVAWASSFFNLATMPNSVFIGPPLLTALFPGTLKYITALVFTQFSLWSSVCVLILEIHKAVYENSEEFHEAKKNIGADQLQGISLSARDFFQQGEKKEHQQPKAADDPAIDIPQAAVTEFEDPQKIYAQEGVEEVRKTKRQVAKKIAQTVLLKFLLSQLVWGSILGFSFSLLNFRLNQGKPLPVILKSWIDLIANGTLGICMFMLGMNMGVAPELFACGIPKALLSAGVRFIVAPAGMALVSFAIGLRGHIFRFAVLQAMVPQAVASFVWATQYNVHVDIFSTAVWFQTAIFIPFAIALYKLLSVGGGVGS